MPERRRRRTLAGSALALAGALAALHCGNSDLESTFTGPLGPCETVFKDQCGTPCTQDVDCANGLYCGSGGKCTADCAPGATCGVVACSKRGRCGPDDPQNFEDAAADASGDAVCADIDVALTKLVPKVLFLLDQSSSMIHNNFPTGGSETRWAVLKDVLIGPASAPGGVVKDLEAEAELGVEMYSATDSNPSDGDNSFLPPPTDNVCPRFNGKAFDGVSFARNNAAAIDALVRPASVDDDTPTGPALRAVVGLSDDGGVGDPKGFAAIPSTAPKVIVLVTDGEPALCGENYPSDPGRAAVILAAQQAFAQNVRTFVIAIGDTTPQALAHFKAVANAGQGLDPATGNASAIQPSTPKQLVDALTKLVLDARSCSFTLKGQVQPGAESLGSVTLNGKTVPLAGAGADGWRLKDASTLELVGKTCETLKATPNASLTARFPCGTVIPR